MATSSAAQAAMLRERARIARDLHDSVAQTLYAIALTAARAREVLAQNEATDVQRAIDEVMQLANTGQSELRALLTNIRPGERESAGLCAGLTDLAADVRKRNGLDVRLSLADASDVPNATTATLLLICREALHNAVKHARANRVDIDLQVGVDAIEVTITDDGRGFVHCSARPGHFGLQSMRERAATAGGTLELTSARGLGTRIRAWVPRACARRKATP